MLFYSSNSPCILQSCYNCLLVPGVLICRLFMVFYIDHHFLYETNFFLPNLCTFSFLSSFPPFLSPHSFFLSSFYHTGLIIRCWIWMVRLDNSILVPKYLGTSFSSLNMMLALGVLWMFLINLKKFLYSYLAENVIISGAGFCQML